MSLQLKIFSFIVTSIVYGPEPERFRRKCTFAASCRRRVLVVPNRRQKHSGPELNPGGRVISNFFLILRCRNRRYYSRAQATKVKQKCCSFLNSFVLSVVIDDRLRGKGLGRLLMLKTEEEAVKCVRIDSCASLCPCSTARRLYNVFKSLQVWVQEGLPHDHRSRRILPQSRIR